MLREIDNFYLEPPEPVKSCLQALRQYILNYDPNLREAWKYKMPFFLYNGKMFCYLWRHKNTQAPYLGIVEGRKLNHPLLTKGDRSRMKILPIDPNKDLPLETINSIFKQLIPLYTSSKGK